MQIDQRKVRELRHKMQEAMKVFEQETGLTVKVGSATFSNGHVEFKVDASTKNTDGTVNDKYAEGFRLNCHRYDLKESALGATFMYSGRKWKVTGANPRAYRYPILTVCEANGERMRFTPSLVRDALPDHVIQRKYTVKRI